MRALLLAALMLVGATAAQAEGETDCPLATQGYSADTIMADLLLNPDTRAVLAANAPQLVATGPGLPDLSQVPGFGVILAVREAAKWTGVSDEAVAQIDRELRAVPVSHATSVARCARYDHVPPVLPEKIAHPAILVFEKISGFKDTPSFDAAHAALVAMAERRGWTLVFSDNGAVFNDADLKRFDAVVWNNVSGDVLTVPQEDAFRRYIEAGGGYAGFHGSGGDPTYVWDWYADTLIGARFIGHPRDPQFQEGRLTVADPDNAITKGLGDGWTMTEEWYSFKASPRLRGAHILVTLDEASYVPGAALTMGDHPIAWTQCIGKGRSFYSAIGHIPANYAEQHSLALLENGIAWAAGQGATSCT